MIKYFVNFQTYLAFLQSTCLLKFTFTSLGACKVVHTQQNFVIKHECITVIKKLVSKCSMILRNISIKVLKFLTCKMLLKVMVIAKFLNVRHQNRNICCTHTKCLDKIDFKDKNFWFAFLCCSIFYNIYDTSTCCFYLLYYLLHIKV